jgi:hypothetical protein
MGIIRTYTATAFVYGIAFIVAYLAFLRLCLTILLHPTRIFWRVKRRETAPECLTDPAYGIHGYLPIEVRSSSVCLAVKQTSKIDFDNVCSLVLCFFFPCYVYLEYVLIVVIPELGIYKYFSFLLVAK